MPPFIGRRGEIPLDNHGRIFHYGRIDSVADEIFSAWHDSIVRITSVPRIARNDAGPTIPEKKLTNEQKPGRVYGDVDKTLRRCNNDLVRIGARARPPTSGHQPAHDS